MSGSDKSWWIAATAGVAAMTDLMMTSSTRRISRPTSFPWRPAENYVTSDIQNVANVH